MAEEVTARWRPPGSKRGKSKKTPVEILRLVDHVRAYLDAERANPPTRLSESYLVLHQFVTSILLDSCEDQDWHEECWEGLTFEECCRPCQARRLLALHRVDKGMRHVAPDVSAPPDPTPGPSRNGSGEGIL